MNYSVNSISCEKVQKLSMVLFRIKSYISTAMNKM